MGGIEDKLDMKRIGGGDEEQGNPNEKSGQRNNNIRNGFSRRLQQ